MTASDDTHSNGKNGNGAESDGDSSTRYEEMVTARVPAGANERLELAAYEGSEPGKMWSKAEVIRHALDEYLEDFEFVIDDPNDRVDRE